MNSWVHSTRKCVNLDEDQYHFAILINYWDDLIAMVWHSWKAQQKGPWWLRKIWLEKNLECHNEHVETSVSLWHSLEIGLTKKNHQGKTFILAGGGDVKPWNHFCQLPLFIAAEVRQSCSPPSSNHFLPRMFPRPKLQQQQRGRGEW